MSSQAPEFTFTRSGESGIIPRAPLPGLSQHVGSLITPNVLQRFRLEEAATGLPNNEGQELTDAHLNHYAETLPPRQAIDTTFALIVQQVEQHPFIRGGLSEVVTNTSDQGRAWIGAGKFEGGTFREGLGLLLTRLPEGSPTHDAARKNWLEENGKSLNNSWMLHNRHTDDFRYLAEGLFGQKEAEHIFLAGSRKPGVRLAGELAVTLGAHGSLFENLGSFIGNEGLTKYTYGAAQRTLERFSDPDKVFFEEHIVVDEGHVNDMIDATVEELGRSGQPVRDLKTVLRAMRMTWTVGMQPWLNELMQTGWQKGQGGINLSAALRRHTDR